MALFFKKFFLDIFFPVICLNCRRELPSGDYLCGACFKKLKFYSGAPKLDLKFLDELNIAGDYEDRSLSGLIKILKFNAVPAAAKILGQWLLLFWQGQAVFKSPQLLVIPIPLSARRQKWRGFNQAEIIARYLANNFNYQLSLDLIKIKETKAQSRLSAKKRINNLNGAFKWSGEIPIAKDILLIDDVITTGATLEEAARVLKAAGAKMVIGLAVAKG